MNWLFKTLKTSAESILITICEYLSCSIDFLDKMLAVHGGIGENQAGVEKLCAEAVKLARLDVVKAVMFLEDDGITNCGLGSSLTNKKTIECEAGFMSSNKLIFGSVGALTNSKHPSMLAYKLAMAQLNESNLTHPNCLVGNGADAFAIECEDVPTCSNSDLITRKSLKCYEKAMIILSQQRWDTVINLLDTFY